MNDSDCKSIPMSVKQRLSIEKSELTIKLDKLDEFLLSEKVKDADYTQLGLMRVQVVAMNAYLQCLNERLERMKD